MLGNKVLAEVGFVEYEQNELVKAIVRLNET